jgi:large subunit ribosomal protein L4
MTKLKFIKVDGKPDSIDLKASSEVSAYQNSLVARAHKQSVKQGTKHAKGRSEVRGHSAKPFRQKGTGNARQGSTKGPHMRGGGVSHGPRMDTTRIKLSKKMRSSSLTSVLREFVNSQNVVFVEPGAKRIDEDKYLRSVLIYSVENKDKYRSIRNTPRMDMLNFSSISSTRLTKYSRIYVDSTLIEKIEKLVA